MASLSAAMLRPLWPPPAWTSPRPASPSAHTPRPSRLPRRSIISSRSGSRRRGGARAAFAWTGGWIAKADGEKGVVKGRVRASEASGDLLTEEGSAANAEEDPETCEIVQGSNVTLGEGDNAFQGYLIQAIKNNNGVAVLFLTDFLGFEDGDSRDFAYRLACFGYNVLVPDLFRGIPWTKERPKSELEDWRSLHAPDRVAGDIDVATAFLAENIDAVGKLSAIGFSFGGGRLIETLARDADGHFATGAFLYGTRVDSALGAQIKVPLLLIAGDSDDSCSLETVHHLERQIPGSKAKIYPGFGHAFADHPGSADEDEAAEDVFTEIRHWLHAHCLPNSTPPTD